MSSALSRTVAAGPDPRHCVAPVGGANVGRVIHTPIRLEAPGGFVVAGEETGYQRVLRAVGLSTQRPGEAHGVDNRVRRAGVET